MKIRNATQNDRSEYLGMAHAFYHSDAVCHPIPDVHLERTFDEALSNNPFLRVIILEFDDNVAGFAHLSFTWSTEAGGMVVLIEDLYIKPAFRGKGLGSFFFNAIFDEYEPLACRYRLEVSESNKRAKKLYESLGFEDLKYGQMVRETPKE